MLALQIPPHARAIIQGAMALMLPLSAMAQATDKPGYLQDSGGNFVYSGTPGQCWHTSDWTPAMAKEGCDPVAKRIAIASAVVVAAAPVVVPAPVSPRAPMAPVAAAPPQRIRFSADTLFAFDKAIISSEAKVLLDEASVRVLSLNGEKVRVVGHADRIGTDAYNQTLSSQRAFAVRDYLIFKGVPAAVLESVGVGEREPVTRPEDCAGPRSAKVIACLQPDRRVDVEVQGFKAAAAP